MVTSEAKSPTGFCPKVVRAVRLRVWRQRFRAGVTSVRANVAAPKADCGTNRALFSRLRGEPTAPLPKAKTTLRASVGGRARRLGFCCVCGRTKPTRRVALCGRSGARRSEIARVSPTNVSF